MVSVERPYGTITGVKSHMPCDLTYVEEYSLKMSWMKPIREDSKGHPSEMTSPSFTSSRNKSTLSGPGTPSPFSIAVTGYQLDQQRPFDLENPTIASHKDFWYTSPVLLPKTATVVQRNSTSLRI
jgi:hypothetical protein